MASANFEVVCEVQPSTRPDLMQVRHQIGVLRRLASGSLIPNNLLGRAMISSVAVAHEVDQMGGRSIACPQCHGSQSPWVPPRPHDFGRLRGGRVLARLGRTAQPRGHEPVSSMCDRCSTRSANSRRPVSLSYRSRLGPVSRPGWPQSLPGSEKPTSYSSRLALTSTPCCVGVRRSTSTRRSTPRARAPERLAGPKMGYGDLRDLCPRAFDLVEERRSSCADRMAHFVLYHLVRRASGR